jgi:PAS domain S-box-containing protein
MNNTPTAGSSALPPLETVLCTEELNHRPSRPPDYETGNRALVLLARALADSPSTILQTFAETILTVLQCGSAGVSLVTADGARFHWPAIAGAWAPHIGGGTSRNFGPCGDAFDRNCPLLFKHFERRYLYFLPVTPPIEECLLVPFYVAAKAVGTIWAITHDDRPGARKFDNEDVRMLESLGTFASAAYQAVEQLRAFREQDQERQEAANALRDMNEALLVSSVKQHELAEQATNAETAMRNSERRYRRLFESAKDGILILDVHSGRITDANASLGGLIETASNELLGKELWEVGLFSDKSASEAAVRELQTKGFIRYENLTLESTRGRLVDVEVIANVYREDHHSVVQCNIRDITERTRLERKTHEQAAALADLDRRKDEFLAMLSHELRNPLAPILNAALMLRLDSNRNRLQGIENPILHQATGIIERQVGQLARIVDELLDVSRITTGRIQLQQKPIAVVTVAENAVATVRPLFDQHKHELTVSLPAQSIWLNADAARLEQVIVNLLSNAAKYTERGGHVWLTVQQEGEDAVFRVRDTGVGIAPDVLPRVFDLFAQAERSLDRSQGGLGIGLALVQRLVQMHGGTVTAFSILGQGSEFVVRLPVVSPPERQASSPSSETAQTSGRSLRVLVVDDNVDTATSLALLAKMSGHDVRAAYDGTAVEEAALDYRPDVVLLDIGLPGLNGFEIAKRLRNQPTLRNSVLVAMTGYGAPSDLQRSFEAGFDHHLVKPADIGKVLQILATVSELTAQGTLRSQ